MNMTIYDVCCLVAFFVITALSSYHVDPKRCYHCGGAFFFPTKKKICDPCQTAVEEALYQDWMDQVREEEEAERAMVHYDAWLDERYSTGDSPYEDGSRFCD